jgi:hypothetical protein
LDLLATIHHAENMRELTGTKCAPATASPCSSAGMRGLLPDSRSTLDPFDKDPEVGFIVFSASKKVFPKRGVI